MTPAQRSSYFLLWADVCAVQGWPAKNNAKRQEITARCMAAVRGPAVISTSELGEAEITALFCFLEYLKTGDANLDAAARWVDCQQDYKAFALARNADWHEAQLYGKSKKPNKLDRERFAGDTSAVGAPLEKFDPKKIRQRHVTMASRNQKRARKEGRPKPSAATTSAPSAAPAKAPAIAPAARATPPAMPVAEPAATTWDGQF